MQVKGERREHIEGDFFQSARVLMTEGRTGNDLSASGCFSRLLKEI